MNSFTTRTGTRITARRVVIPATLVFGASAGTVFGMTQGESEPDAADIALASVDSEAIARVEEPAGDSQPDDTSVTTLTDTPPTADLTPATSEPNATSHPDGNDGLEASTGYTLDDAAQVGDPRVADIECAYLSREDDDPLAAVADFRADRDRFFDIDSALVQDARLDGLTFAEIAADFGYSVTDVQDGAAAMHGYCFEQLIGEGLTQAQAEARFDTTITRFLTLMDAEPDENGRGAGVDPSRDATSGRGR